jgi:uncharacterized membrane protein
LILFLSSIKKDFFENYLPFKQGTINLTLASMMTALVCVATLFFQIPIAATGGYFNVGEAVIYISAILFGPIIGGFAGGVGAALADVMSPYFIYAPGTLIFKFCEGFVIGYIVYRAHLQKWEGWKVYTIIITAVVIGGLIMVLGYFLYEAYVLSYGVPAAMGEIPFNLTQLLIGSIVAIPVSIGIQKAYPILESPAEEKT